MRVAIIDLGTNSVRFDIHQFGPGRKLTSLHREKLMVRLGQGVFLNGRLDKEAITRTLNAFQRFRDVARKLRVEKVLAFGTSALREVADRERFLETIRTQAGIDVRVISGVEEAKLIALGVLSKEKLPKGKFALIDIGGGSTEISICRGKEILHSMSFPLGTARLQQVFLKRSPPELLHVQELRRFIRNTLFQEILSERWPKVERVIGSSGTIKALGKLLKLNKEGTHIDAKFLHDRVEQMCSMTTTELLGLSGMESKRVDMILAGAILFDECMSVLGAKKAETTEYSLRDGLLEEEVRLFKEGETSHLSLHEQDLYDKAIQFGANELHLRRVVRLSGQLFSKLSKIHKLAPHWQIYLSAAVILRDMGESVSLAQHELHSSYIIRNTDLPPMEEWETEMIARLVLHHEGVKLDGKELPFGKSKERRDAFQKLLALLRVVDALDPGSDTQVSLKSVRLVGSHLTLIYGGRKLTGLESLNVELKSPYFEKIFRRTLSAQSG